MSRREEVRTRTDPGRPSTFRVRAVFLATLAATLATACGTPSPPADLPPPDVFAWAQARFDAGEYPAAAQGFQSFLFRDPLHPLSDSAQFMLAESNLRSGKGLDAAEEFARLATGRPNSPWADDAQFGVCRAYYAASPKISLSQEFTERAIQECQRMLQFFPTSDLRQAAEEELARARAKLARKSYMIGKYYFDRRLYESANVYLEKALSEGPAPDVLPEILLTLYESYHRVGFDTEATTIRERLLTDFPDSEEAARLRGNGDGAD